MRRVPVLLRGGLLRGGDGDGIGQLRIVASTVWLAFIAFPLVDAVGTHGSSLPRGVVIAAAVTFIAGYLALVISWRRRADSWQPLALFALLIAVATLLSVSEPSGWGYLFTYCVACATIISPDRFVLPAVGTCVALAVGTSMIGGASTGNTIGAGATASGIGLLMLLMRDLRLRNEELCQARAELARLAVARERERFARDLHDLLGHSLSVIALKAELAGRLLPGRASDAAGEVADVERVARQALAEVRQAVGGYRQPTLEGELEGAVMALSAAGIETAVRRPGVPLDPAVDAVLAWAVREGATNVIRHSRAKHVSVRVRGALGEAGVEVLDDGEGAPPGSASGLGINGQPGQVVNGQAGHGIAGLAERVESLRGRVEAGPRAEGGFRLSVTVPLART